MPAIDNCQPQVIHALEKDGWRVHLQNAHFYNDGDSIYIDLGVKKSSTSSDSDSIFIEIKCFSEKRSLPELYLALGLVSYYRAFLDELDNNASLYLAVPYEIYLTQLNRMFENVLKQNRVGLLVIDIVSEEIIEWIK